MSVAHNGEVTSTHLAPPPGLLPRKGKKSCTALTKSSKGAALPCPQEKQRGSCTALTEKQRVAALRPKNSNGDSSLRVLEAYDPKRLYGCGFVLLLLVIFFFFLFFFCSAGTPPGLLPTSGGGSRSSRPACLSFRWGMMPVATDMFRSYDAMFRSYDAAS